MKILVVSLLRIGDIVLSTPVLRGLRERHPNAEIHLLINSQFKQVAPLIPYVNRTLMFERGEMQKGLGDIQTPIFESYERLQSLVEDLNSENYDWIINLTHSRLSGWLLSLLPAKKKTGLCLDGAGQAGFGSNWFRYLNNQVDVQGEETFHFTDIFRFALELGEEGLNRPALVETEEGLRESQNFLNTIDSGDVDKPVMAVQVLTSDVKKDWGVEKYAQALQQFQRVHPNVHIAVVGAPFERDRLVPLMRTLEEQGVRASLAILSFEGAFSLLKSKRCALLLTGDTSIKHLASAARTPTVELCLGSSDPHRTGSYLQGSVIVKSREACAPCVHSSPCHRETHACAKRIPAGVVAMVISEVYAGRSFQLSAIAEEFKDQVDILRVEMRGSGFWAAHSVLEPFTEETIGRWVDLACRKIWLQATESGETQSRIGRGTEIRKLSNLLRTIHPQVSDIEWRHLLGDFERQACLVESRIHGFKVGIQYLRSCYEDPKRFREYIRGLIAFRERIRHSALLRSFKASLDQIIEDDITPAFTRFRKTDDLISEIESRTEIHLKIIRGLLAEIDGEATTHGIEKI